MHYIAAGQLKAKYALLLTETRHASRCLHQWTKSSLFGNSVAPIATRISLARLSYEDAHGVTPRTLDCTIGGAARRERGVAPPLPPASREPSTGRDEGQAPAI